MSLWPFGGPRKRRVLVVDDDPNARLLLTSLFTEMGWDVAEARDGLEGVSAAAAAPPDLIVLDVDMPRLSGADALVRLRAAAATAKVPVMMATARQTLDDVERCLQRGANDYVTKPYELAVILAKAEKLVAPPAP